MKRKVAQLAVSGGDGSTSVNAASTAGTSVSTLATIIDWAGLAFSGKSAKNHKKWKFWRTFRAFIKIACNSIILVHRLSLCLDGVRVYESPTIPNRLQAIKSFNRWIISKTKSVPEQFDRKVYGRTELGQHADTIVVRGNCIILKYTDRSCMVSPYDTQEYEPIHNFPIVAVATGYTSKKWEKLYFGIQWIIKYSYAG